MNGLIKTIEDINVRSVKKHTCDLNTFANTLKWFIEINVWLVLMKSVKVDLLIAQLWYLMSKSIGRILQLWNPDLCVVLWKNVEKNFKVVETLVTMLTRNIGYQKNSVRVQYHLWELVKISPS